MFLGHSCKLVPGTSHILLFSNGLSAIGIFILQARDHVTDKVTCPQRLRGSHRWEPSLSGGPHQELTAVVVNTARVGHESVALSQLVSIHA